MFTKNCIIGKKWYFCESFDPGVAKDMFLQQGKTLPPKIYIYWGTSCPPKFFPIFRDLKYKNKFVFSKKS